MMIMGVELVTVRQKVWNVQNFQCLCVDPQQMLCRYGLGMDLRGCPICFCRQEAGCYPVSPSTCDLECLYGYATKEDGCETCRCRIFDSAICDQSVSSTCPKKCPYGLGTDGNGCEICSCKNQVSFTGIQLEDRTVENCRESHKCTYGLCTDEQDRTICKCKLPVDNSCTLECSNGFATEQHDCEICKCKLLCVEQCRLTCPFGLATDNMGCEICRCKVPATIIAANVPYTMGIEIPTPSSRPLNWIPSVTCPTLAACSLSCNQGYATNIDGCTVCRCIADESCSPSFNSSLCPIMDLCPYGLATSDIGCPICKCRQPTPCPATLPIFCLAPCPHGFASDSFGCPKIALCDCIRPANDPLCHPEFVQNCNRVCFHGYATDTNACEICRCRMPFTLGAFFSIAAPAFNVYWQETSRPHIPFTEISLVPASPCPLLDSRTCHEDCRNGLATDMRGCPVCRCKTQTELCPRIDPVICPQVHACQFGLATGPTGCDICICKHEVSCEPINHLTCSTSCLHGHATDENGCEVCQNCSMHAGDCPQVTNTNCLKHCLHGYASNDEGCPICKCKQAASHFPLRSVLHSKLFDSYLTSRCSDVSCDLHCHHGYQLDSSGCGLCECISGKFLHLAALSRQNKCHYGFSPDERGCRKKVYCQEITPFNCPLICDHGYASDIHGCDVCRCKLKKLECDDPCLSPMMHCAFGLATDHLRCEICSCKMPVATGLVLAPGTKPRNCVALSTKSCDLSCDHGKLFVTGQLQVGI